MDESTEKAAPDVVGPTVREVVFAVWRKDRTPADLGRCGCATCKKALKVLAGIEPLKGADE